MYMKYTDVSIKEMRERLAEIVDRVAIGRESFRITKFGKTKAILSPLQPRESREERRQALEETAGMWQDREDIVDSRSWTDHTRQQLSSRYEKVFD